MDLSQLKAFIAVARHGGFAKAAQQQNVAPSSITRAVSRLEDSVGVRLFQRTTRRVSLTEAGEDFLARIAPAVEEIAGAVSDLENEHNKPSGVLRVGASVAYGQKILTPRLPAFVSLYPDVHLELILNDSVSDLVSERIDVALRHGRLDDSSLITQRLHSVEYWLVASPDYLKNAPPLRRPQDITRHQCLSFTYSAYSSVWRFARNSQKVDVAINPILKMSNALTLSEATQSGMGVSLLADWTVAADVKAGRLTRCLKTWASSGANDPDDAVISILTPSRAYVPLKTRAFVDFLKQSIER